MSLWVYVPLFLSVVFGIAAPELTRSLPPSVGTWLLSGGGLLAALASSATFALLTFMLLAQSPALSARGQWSAGVLRGHDPTSVPAGALAALAVVLLATRFLRVGRSRFAALRDAYRLAASFPRNGSELTVLRTGSRQAFAVPGRPGRIVVSADLLHALDAPQRRALLAHERAHLRHHHHLHQTVVHLAAAVNPALWLLRAAIEQTSERWADEDAARVCRRGAVADALTTAATAGRHRTSGAVLAATGTDVAARIGALRAPAPRLALVPLSLLTGLIVTSALAVALAMHDTEHLFELAQHTYRAGRR